MVGRGRRAPGCSCMAGEDGRVQLLDPCPHPTIHAVIRGAAFAAALGRRLLHDRLIAQTERIREYLGDALRTGVSVSEAGQRYCALASPELYYLLTVEFDWTADLHREWLMELLAAELLERPASE